METRKQRRNRYCSAWVQDRLGLWHSRCGNLVELTITPASEYEKNARGQVIGRRAVFYATVKRNGQQSVYVGKSRSASGAKRVAKRGLASRPWLWLGGW